MKGMTPTSETRRSTFTRLQLLRMTKKKDSSAEGKDEEDVEVETIQ
jgi:hypothetical protein